MRSLYTKKYATGLKNIKRQQIKQVKSGRKEANKGAKEKTNKKENKSWICQQKEG